MTNNRQPWERIRVAARTHQIMKRPTRSVYSSGTLSWLGARLPSRFGLVLLGSCLVSLACSSGAPRDLGSSSAPLASDGEQPLAPQDFVGNWVATATDPLTLDQNGKPVPLHFGSGSSRISLQIYGDGVFNDRFASLTFGEGERFDPPTDPQQLPPGIVIDPITDTPITPPYEGFPYALSVAALPSDYNTLTDGPLGNAALKDNILRFAFYTDEIYEDHCALQPQGTTNALKCDCSSGYCHPNYQFPLSLLLRHSSNALVGIVTGTLEVPNDQGAMTALGQIQFQPAEAKTGE